MNRDEGVLPSLYNKLLNIVKAVYIDTSQRPWLAFYHNTTLDVMNHMYMKYYFQD